MHATPTDDYPPEIAEQRRANARAFDAPKPHKASKAKRVESQLK